MLCVPWSIIPFYIVQKPFPSFNAWLVDGKIQIESNLPLVTHSADYLIHIVLQDSKPYHIFNPIPHELWKDVITRVWAIMAHKEKMGYNT